MKHAISAFEKSNRVDICQAVNTHLEQRILSHYDLNKSKSKPKRNLLYQPVKRLP